MIGRLQGILVAKHPPQLLLDIGGVAYEIEASMNTFYRLPEVGEQATLHTHFVVRDDAQLLYGFYEQRERSLFRQLIKVNGVGPKLALTILSSLDPDEFVHCVADNDCLRLMRTPGVGKKTAERLIIEMRDRLKSWQAMNTSHDDNHLTMTTEAYSAKIPEQEAIHALVSLGYKPQEASRAMSKLDIAGLSVEEIIRLSLKAMASG